MQWERQWKNIVNKKKLFSQLCIFSLVIRLSFLFLFLYFFPHPSTLTYHHHHYWSMAPTNNNHFRWLPSTPPPFPPTSLILSFSISFSPHIFSFSFFIYFMFFYSFFLLFSLTSTSLPPSIHGFLKKLVILFLYYIGCYWLFSLFLSMHLLDLDVICGLWVECRPAFFMISCWWKTIYMPLI